MRRIASRKVDELDLSVEIHSEKMARVSCIVSLPNHRVDLVRAWIPIAQVIKAPPDPADGELAQEYDHYGQRHADPDAHQWDARLPPPLETCCGFPCGNIRRRSRLRGSRSLGLGSGGSADARRLLPFTGGSDGAVAQRALRSQAIG